MKITGIGPTTGPQTIDDEHSQQELEIADLVNDTFSPVDELGAGGDPSDEQQAQEGLARLFDFLKEKQNRKSRRDKGLTKVDHAIDVYQRVKNGDLNTRGTTLKRRV